MLFMLMTKWNKTWHIIAVRYFTKLCLLDTGKRGTRPVDWCLLGRSAGIQTLHRKEPRVKMGVKFRFSVSYTPVHNKSCSSHSGISSDSIGNRKTRKKYLKHQERGIIYFMEKKLNIQFHEMLLVVRKELDCAIIIECLL